MTPPGSCIFLAASGTTSLHIVIKEPGLATENEATTEVNSEDINSSDKEIAYFSLMPDHNRPAIEADLNKVDHSF